MHSNRIRTALSAARSVVFYDLFRVENGKIAEHWDTIETPSTMTTLRGSDSDWTTRGGRQPEPAGPNAGSY
jgi:predicted SnoaL-like aldol condensation-catalyzing enzyme